MPYATPSQIESLLSASEYLALSDRDRDGVSDPGVVEKAIAHAEGIANGYLAKSPESPPIPLVVVPDAVSSAVVDIAIYRLANSDATEDQLQRYKDAREYLRDIARGIAALGLPADDNNTDIEYDAPPALFSRTKTSGLF